jgi:hypothetical protein
LELVGELPAGKMAEKKTEGGGREGRREGGREGGREGQLDYGCIGRSESAGEV